MKCKHSKATRALSVMSLPEKKALWLIDMMSPRIGRSLLTRHFAMTLYNTEHKLIGRKSFNVYGCSVLGMRAMAVSLTPSGIDPVRKNSLTAFTTSAFRVS
jgi:hypothetical protein